jgi:hypothetical protein
MEQKNNAIYAGVTRPQIAIEDGTYPAKLVQIFQIGSHYFCKKNANGDVISEWYSPQILLGFELPTVVFETAEGVKMSTLKSSTYFLSMNESRNGIGLREIIDGLRGSSEYTSEELEQFDISKFLGKTCWLKLTEVDSKGKIYTNISEITPIKPEDVASIQIDPEVTRRTPILITLGDFKNIESLELPQWIEEKIKSSQEYLEMAENDKKSPSMPEMITAQGVEEEEEIRIEDVPF